MLEGGIDLRFDAHSGAAVDAAPYPEVSCRPADLPGATIMLTKFA